MKYIIFIGVILFGIESTMAQRKQPPSIPTGTVAFFVDASPNCPAGWKEAQYAQGRLIMPVTDTSLVGKQIGTAIRNEEAPGHTHPYTGNAMIGYKGSATVGGSDKDVGKSGNY